jgi:hypothetical protein
MSLGPAQASAGSPRGVSSSPSSQRGSPELASQESDSGRERQSGATFPGGGGTATTP